MSPNLNLLLPTLINTLIPTTLLPALSLLSLITTIPLLFIIIKQNTTSRNTAIGATLLFCVMPIPIFLNISFTSTHLSVPIILLIIHLTNTLKSAEKPYSLYIALITALLTDLFTAIALIPLLLHLLDNTKSLEYRKLRVPFILIVILTTLVNTAFLTILNLNLHLNLALNLSAPYILLGPTNVTIAIALAIYALIRTPLHKNQLFYALPMLLLPAILSLITKSPNTATYWPLLYVLLISITVSHIKQKIWTGNDLRYLGFSITAPLIIITLITTLGGITGKAPSPESVLDTPQSSIADPLDLKNHSETRVSPTQ